MWTPSNRNAIPIADDIIKAKRSMNILEENLNDAQIRVQQLTEELESLRAWASPVRRLPFEVLSPIFVLCGEMSWKAPLTIAAVCRRWREAVRNTPGAWFSVKLNTVKNISLVGLYLERSQRLLHVNLRTPAYLLVLTPHADYLQCMQVPELPDDRNIIRFINLRSLRITSQQSRVRLDQVTSFQFPSLCHLEVAGSFIDHWDAPSMVLPPIQALTLAIRFNDRRGHPGILRGLQATLTSLEIFFLKDPFSASSLRIHLPRLRCLTFHRYTGGIVLPQLITPVLSTYIQWNSFHTSDSLIHGDVKSITHLRFSNFRCPTSFPQVRVLQLSIAAHELVQAMKALQDYDKLPKLEIVEFRLHGLYDMVKGRVTLNEWIEKYRPDLRILVTKDQWIVDLPGTLQSWAPRPYYSGMFVTPPEIKYPR